MTTSTPLQSAPPRFALDRLDAGDPGAIDALHHALRSQGFVYIDADTVLDAGSLTNVLGEARAFFDLSQAEKDALDLDLSPNYRGYVGMGAEYTNGVADVKESFEFAPETVAPAVAGEPPPYFKLYGANQWPDPGRLPRFRPALETYSAAVERIGRSVLQAVARTLDQPTTSAPGEGLFGGDLCSFSRLIYYAEAADTGDAPARREAHTDHTLLTVILQSSPGLEVADGDGWQPVTASPDTFLVFLGEMMEFWTRGYYTALPHRVYDAALAAERVSIATFFLPDLRNRVAPIVPSTSTRMASAELSLSADNSWLTPSAVDPPSTGDAAGPSGSLQPIIVGEKEWQRIHAIFPEQSSSEQSSSEQSSSRTSSSEGDA
ncbi:MAG: 2-oxoglutarate and iron-dependent oxygenase domain-containing protein [Acidobacteriota bacterium]